MFFGVVLLMSAITYTYAQKSVFKRYSVEMKVPFSHWSVSGKTGGSYFRTGSYPYNAGTSILQKGRLDLTSVLGGTIEYSSNSNYGLGVEGTYIGYSRFNATDGVHNVRGEYLSGSTKDVVFFISLNLLNIMYPHPGRFWNQVGVYANAGLGTAFYQYQVGKHTSNGMLCALIGMESLSVEYNISKTLAFGAEAQYRYYRNEKLGYYPNPSAMGYSDAFVATVLMRYKFCNSSFNIKHVRNVTSN